jgi:hypothetical protein
MTVTDSLPTVAGLIGALSRIETFAFMGTLVAPFGGLIVTTAGGAVCAPVPVVKLVKM